MAWTTFPHKIWNPFVQLDIHSGVFTLIPGLALHLSAGALAQARIVWENKENQTVIADNFATVSKGHTSGLIIPHWNVAPITPNVPPFVYNAFLPFIIALSENECKFAVSSVQCPNKDIAVSIFQIRGFNWACNGFGVLGVKGLRVKGLGVKLPTSEVLNWGTVIIGFTLTDLYNLLKELLYEYTIGLVISYFAGKAAKKIGNFLSRGGGRIGLRISIKREILNLMRKSEGKGVVTATQEVTDKIGETIVKLGIKISDITGSVNNNIKLWLGINSEPLQPGN